jgi:hypothetical protein
MVEKLTRKGACAPVKAFSKFRKSLQEVIQLCLEELNFENSTVKRNHR